jgi:YHS domain-containing protein
VRAEGKLVGVGVTPSTISAEVHGHTHYFCSAHGRNNFLKDDEEAPAAYE